MSEICCLASWFLTLDSNLALIKIVIIKLHDSNFKISLTQFSYCFP